MKISFTKRFVTQVFTLVLIKSLAVGALAEVTKVNTRSAEEVVSGMFANLTSEPPEGADIQCDFATDFSFIKMYTIDLQLDNHETKKICKSIDQYNQIYVNLQKFFPVDESFGLQLRLIDSADELNGAYSPRQILNKNISPRIVIFHYEQMNYSLNAPIWAHEYGHAFFGRQMDQLFFPIAKQEFIREIDFQMKNEEWGRKKNFLINEYKQLQIKSNQLFNADGSKLQLEEISLALVENSISKSLHQVELYIKANKRSHSLGFLSLPYHEFFADVFAGLYYSDMNIIGDTFSMLGGEFSQKSEFRSFQPKTLETIKLEGWRDYETHHFFTPARHHLGLESMQMIIASGKQQELLTRLSQFMLEDIKWLAYEAPEQEFISYQSVVNKVQFSKNTEDIRVVFDELMLPGRARDVHAVMSNIYQLCDKDFSRCKQLIMSQLKLRRRGLFYFAPDIERSNKRMILALDKILTEMSSEKYKTQADNSLGF